MAITSGRKLEMVSFMCLDGCDRLMFARDFLMFISLGLDCESRQKPPYVASGKKFQYCEHCLMVIGWYLS
jgi:hypothetical protein